LAKPDPTTKRITVALAGNPNCGKSTVFNMLTGARQLGEVLTPVVGVPVQVDHPQVVVNRRRGGAVDYLFLVNDAAQTPLDDQTFKRRLRLNHFGIMPMRFPPVRTQVRLKHAGAAYDLTTRQPVGRRGRDGQLRWTVNLPPGGGRMVALLAQPIERVTVHGPDSVYQGEPFQVTGRVESVGARAPGPVRGQPIELRRPGKGQARSPASAPVGQVVRGAGRVVRGVVPVRVRLIGPWRRARTVHCATRDGRFQATLRTDTTTGPGIGTLEVTELISGKTARRMIRLKGRRHKLLTVTASPAAGPAKADGGTKP